MWPITLILLGVVLDLPGCHFGLGPMPSVPDLRGTYIANSATIHAEKPTADEILSTFKKAENAVHSKDLDALMALYADNYKHTGYTKDSLRYEWKQLFDAYHDLSMTHVLTRIGVDTTKTPPTADVTCTGSLWGIANETNQRVSIDSWFGEVHYLIYTDGTWRIRGHAWEMLNTKDTRMARPPHPFF